MIIVHFQETKKAPPKKPVSNNTSNQGTKQDVPEEEQNISQQVAQLFSDTIGGATVLTQPDDSGLYSTRVDWNAAKDAQDNLEKVLKKMGFKYSGTHNNQQFIKWSNDKAKVSVFFSYHANKKSFQLLFVDDDASDDYEKSRKLIPQLSM